MLRLRSGFAKPSDGAPAQRRQLGVAVILGLAFAIVVASAQWSAPVNLRVGQLAPQDVVAPRRILDQPLYAQRKAHAAAQVSPVYISDSSATAKTQSDIAHFFTSISNLQSSLPAKFTAADAEAGWQKDVGIDLPEWAVVAVVKMKPTTLADLQSTADSIVQKVLSSANYKASQLSSERQVMVQAVQAISMPNAQSIFLENLLQQSARPNMIFSASETKKAKQAAQASVTAPFINQGQIIVPKGTRVTSSELKLLAELGLLHGNSNVWAAVGGIVMAVIFSLLVYGAMRVMAPHLLLDSGRLLVLGIVIIGMLIVARLTALLSPFFIPLAAAGVLVSVLVDTRIALLVIVFLVVLLQEVLSFDPRAPLVLLVAGLVGVLAADKPREYKDILRIPVYVALASIIGYLGVQALVPPVVGSSSVFWSDLALSAGGGILAGLLSIGALPFLESAFGLLSAMRLLELSNPNNPMMRRLLMEAPGTYHHSLVLANLVGGALDEIGGNSLLGRVGALYHDIGKLRRPYFFGENLLGGENPHERISPSLSTLIITSHVRDGLEMARDGKLPKEIQDFIAEHHGTSLVSYFFHKAQERSAHGTREEDFRYPGPKPQSRETAVLMLADMCETAVRAMQQKTPGKVEGLIRKLIRQRLYDGQLDESSLTLRDLDVIARMFARVLAGVHHSRIEYPALPSGDKGGRGNGDGKPARHGSSN